MNRSGGAFLYLNSNFAKAKLKENILFQKKIRQLRKNSKLNKQLTAKSRMHGHPLKLT